MSKDDWKVLDDAVVKAAFTRDALVAIQAPEKTGKTFISMDGLVIRPNPDVVCCQNNRLKGPCRRCMDELLGRPNPDAPKEFKEVISPIRVPDMREDPLPGWDRCTHHSGRAIYVRDEFVQVSFCSILQTWSYSRQHYRSWPELGGTRPHPDGGIRSGGFSKAQYAMKAADRYLPKDEE